MSPDRNQYHQLADVSSAVRWTALTVGQWFGLTPDDSPLVTRNSAADYPEWSDDGKYVYFHLILEPGKGNRIVRLRMADFKIETVVAEVVKLDMKVSGKQLTYRALLRL